MTKDNNYNLQEFKPTDKIGSGIAKYWNDSWLGNAFSGLTSFLGANFSKAAFFTIVSVVGAFTYDKYIGQPNKDRKYLEQAFNSTREVDEANYLMQKIGKAPADIQEKMKQEIIKLGQDKDFASKNEKGELVIAPEKLKLSLTDTMSLSDKLNAHLSKVENSSPSTEKAPQIKHN